MARQVLRLRWEVRWTNAVKPPSWHDTIRSTLGETELSATRHAPAGTATHPRPSQTSWYIARASLAVGLRTVGGVLGSLPAEPLAPNGPANSNSATHHPSEPRNSPVRQIAGPDVWTVLPRLFFRCETTRERDEPSSGCRPLAGPTGDAPRQAVAAVRSRSERSHHRCHHNSHYQT